MSSENVFVMALEKNTKENELFIYYVQWNGNEEELTKLFEILKKQSWDDLYGEYCTMSLNITEKLPENIVDIICKSHREIDINCYHRMFSKCTGKFTNPISEESVHGLDECQIASLVDQTFWSCRLPRMFSGYRNPYSELLSGKITEEEYERIKDIYM